jgi:ABC-type amino acid transport substrate-binding protein
LADLRGSSLVVGYRRGVVYCEQELGSVLPAAQIADVTQEEQGLRMLVAGRIDLFCGMDTAVWSAMELPTLRNNGPVRKAVSLQLSALYPYLHPKQAARAAPLAAALKAMKAEGLVERYRLQALRERRQPRPADLFLASGRRRGRTAALGSTTRDLAESTAAPWGRWRRWQRDRVCFRPSP